MLELEPAEKGSLFLINLEFIDVSYFDDSSSLLL